MASPADFASRMNARGDAVERNATVALRKAALASLAAVVMATPVGHPDLWKHKAPPGYVGGRARANWQASVGAPITTIVEAEDAGGQNTIDAGSSTIQSVQDDSAPIHLTNNVPWIVPLNEGHSHQAPAGFVEEAVQAATSSLSGVRILED